MHLSNSDQGKGKRAMAVWKLCVVMAVHSRIKELCFAVSESFVSDQAPIHLSVFHDVMEWFNGGLLNHRRTETELKAVE